MASGGEEHNEHDYVQNLRDTEEQEFFVNSQVQAAENECANEHTRNYTKS